jgi:hypothetical protein
MFHVTEKGGENNSLNRPARISSIINTVLTGIIYHEIV